MKNPSFQFYPGDWLRDNVAGCSLAAQGLWLRMMILAHDCEPYGVLERNGKTIPNEVIARQCGCAQGEFERLLQELDDAGVFSRTRTGAIYSRRMVRDASERKKLSKLRSNAGKSGNAKRWKNNGKNEERSQTYRNCDNLRSQNDRSSSSSSSSSSNKKEKNKKEKSEGEPVPISQVLARMVAEGLGQ